METITPRLRASLSSIPSRLRARGLRAGPLTVYRAGRQLLGDDTLHGQLSSIRVPTLLVWGERDPIVQPRLAAEYQRAITGAELVILVGAGHVPMSDQPDDFAAAVVDFLPRSR